MSKINPGYDIGNAFVQDFFEEYKGLLEMLTLVFQTIAKNGDQRTFNLLLQAITNIAVLAKNHMDRREG
jgi:hypothetical protein